MATERTLSIIKPDATRRNLTGKINAMLEDAGLRIVAQRRMQLTTAQAQAFYAVHAERPFYNDLVSFMISGPVVVQVRHQPGRRRRGHHPQSVRRKHRSQFGARVGQRRKRGQ